MESFCIYSSNAGISVFKISNREKSYTLSFKNVEALANSGTEKVDCSYSRRTPKCEIFIGAKGSIEIAGIGVLKAGADGYIKFDGQVICSANGTESCRPVECADIYKIIFKK